MGQYEVVYVGGPRHGEREAREGDVFDSPDRIVFATRTQFAVGGPEYGEAVYLRRPMADTPGAITYVFESA